MTKSFLEELHIAQGLVAPDAKQAVDAQKFLASVQLPKPGQDWAQKHWEEIQLRMRDGISASKAGETQLDTPRRPAVMPEILRERQLAALDAPRKSSSAVPTSSFTLSEDQQAARDKLLDAVRDGTREMVLTGPAGSGKTTMLRVLIEDLESQGYGVVLVAPTGKAATRLAELTGRTATTVHRPLYLKVQEDEDGKLHFDRPQAIAGENTVVLVDEASMLSKAVHADMTSKLPPGAQLICIGDREQLPPVNDTWGADFANPTAVLTQIHRQALLSPILALATEIRHGKFWRNFEHPGLIVTRNEFVTDPIPPQGRVVRVKQSRFEHAARWLMQVRESCPDTVLLTYTNKSRQALNSLVRSLYGRFDPLEVGDAILCTRNNSDLGVCNGEVRRVTKLEYLSEAPAACVLFEDDVDAIVLPYLLAEQGGGDKKDFARAMCRLDQESKKQVMRAEYGECLTVHKSQGSQMLRVGIMLDFDWLGRRDADTYRRLLYTAVTRACEELVIFEP